MSNKLLKPKKISYKEGETAKDFLNRAIQECIKDEKNGIIRDYFLLEFPTAELIDNKGNEIACRSILLRRQDIDNIIVLKKKNSCSNKINGWAVRIEERLGIPAVSHSGIAENIKIRPLNEIVYRLSKARKRAKYELKAVRDILNSINEPQNPKTIGALTELNWLFNSGDYRSINEIAQRLWPLIVLRERDKLFYVHLHPRNSSLHRCMDEELLARIEVLKWAVYNKNPFKNGENHRGICKIF